MLKGKVLKKIILSRQSKIIDVINNLNESGLRIVLFVDEKKNFAGIIDDGDIRRALLKGYNINHKILNVINKKCYVTNQELNEEDLDRLIARFDNIPIVKNKKIYGLYTKTNLGKIKVKKNKTHVVIMAGGFGKRLGYLTKNNPKALLRYKSKPLIQHIIENINKQGFNNLYISIFYLKDLIKKFIKENNYFNSTVKFIEEKIPLGTIGSLKLIKKVSNNFLLLNCDVISASDLNEMLKFHIKKKAFLTIGIKNYKYKNPYGVVITKGGKFRSFQEKQEIDFNINAGIYAINKRAIKIISNNNFKNIENLIEYLKKKNYKILIFPIIENWLDLGQNKKVLKKFN